MFFAPLLIALEICSRIVFAALNFTTGPKFVDSSSGLFKLYFSVCSLKDSIKLSKILSSTYILSIPQQD